MWNLIRCQGGDLSLHVFSRVLAINSSARKNTKPNIEPWWRRGSEEPGRAQSGRESVQQAFLRYTEVSGTLNDAGQHIANASVFVGLQINCVSLNGPHICENV